MLLMLALMGCSAVPRDKTSFVPEKLQEAKPARPAPLALSDVRYKRCGKMACLTAADAQREVNNKAEVYNWMRGMNALVCYYEVRDGAERCVSGASISQ
jgi:hypothetical protein